MIKFKETKPATSGSLIIITEKLFDINFPNDYKDHILKYNGGDCTPNRIQFFENGVLASSAIGYFYAFYDGKYSNIFTAFSIFKIQDKRMPSNVFPIAYDGLGNQICISCFSNDFGSVYFWDHENEVDYSHSDDNDYSNLYLIAPSFTEFLANLH